jgi:RNA polymerase sigma-70 factor (ECF subfamily)
MRLVSPTPDGRDTAATGDPQRMRRHPTVDSDQHRRRLPGGRAARSEMALTPESDQSQADRLNRNAMDVDDQAFDALYLRVYRRLVAELYGVLGDRQEAEDVVQEAFVRAAARWRLVSSYDQPEAWVRRVAFNLAFTLRRRARRALSARHRLPDAAETTRPSLDGVLLDQALRKLRRRHREVLVLHYLVDLPVDEIARVLNAPAGTIKSRLHAARAALEQELLGGTDPKEVGHA